MKIAHIAPVNFNIPEGRGGPEVSAYNLQEALCDIGVNPVFFTAKNTKASGKKRYIFDTELNSNAEFLASNKVDRAHMISLHHAYAYSFSDQFDIMHSHITPAAFPFAMNQPDVISVLTVQSVASPYLQKIAEKFSHKNMHYVFVSKSESMFFPKSIKNVSVIHHAIDTESIKPVWHKEDWFLYVGRLVNWKRPDVAIRACIRANKKIIVIGAPTPKEHAKQFPKFAKEVQRLLKHKNVTHLQSVKHSKMYSYYKKASALIFPTDHRLEAMPQVTMEAAACGTPVLALKNPLSQEFMEQGKTGFLAKNEKELSLMLMKVHSLNPRDCRAFAEKNFSRKAIAAQYKALYEKLLRAK